MPSPSSRKPSPTSRCSIRTSATEARSGTDRPADSQPAMNSVYKHLDYRHVLWAGVFLLCLSGTAHADGTPPSSYPEILADDVKHVLTAPARWQEQEWQNLGLAAIGVIGVAALVDRPVRAEMRRHAPNNNRFLLTVERFGAEYSLFRF